MIIDTREKQLIKILKEKHLRFKIAKLEVGDVISEPYIFELKNGYDLVGSIYDCRLFFQLSKMKKTELIPILIIYNFNDAYKKIRNRNVINGLMASFIMKNNMVIPLGTIGDVVYVFEKIVRKKSETIKEAVILNYSFPKFKNNFERRVASLSCAKQIGPNLAKILLGRFHSVKGVTENLNRISGMKGFGDKLTENLYSLLVGSE